MVKRQKEKQYQSAREHRANSQIRSGNEVVNTTIVRKLPFNCCALSLMPFTTPVCKSNGIVFEKTAIEAFLAEHKIDPVTGNSMSSKDLIALNMDKDDEGRWQCPVLNKPFADHTKVVAIKQSPPGSEANVYSFDAYQELNVKAKNYEDLISGKKFNKKTDLIILNDPQDQDFHKLRDINTFFHIKNQRQLETTKAPKGNNIRHSVTATRILDKLQKKGTNTNSEKDKNKKRSPQETQDLAKEGKRLKIFSDDVTGVKLTAGKASGSLTSTVMEVTHDNEAREATEEEMLKSMFQVMRRRKKKGYVRLDTNMGQMLLEIHCDRVPRTSTNFIKLCEAKKYNGSSFHRLIKNFMIQGGKPASDAKDEEDESIWGGAFRDEFDDRLKHDAPGVLSMANAGPNTNRRQFFITFKSCEHLNRKHSVFGVVIEGIEILQKMENISTDKKDRPLEPINILDTTVVENPVKEAEEIEMKRIEARAEERRRKEKSVGSTTEPKEKSKTNPTKAASSESKSQIGRYLPKTTAVVQEPNAKDEIRGNNILELKQAVKSKPAQKKTKTKFGNFSSW